MAAFTSIAAGVGIAATAGGVGMNFADAAKQKDMRLKAEEDSAKMMDEARRKMSVNPFAAISLPTEAYKLESEAMLQQGAQLTEAGRESERGAAATAGRVQMAQQQGQQQIRAEMGKDLTNLEMAKAREEGNIRNKMVEIDLAEAEGAQLAAADAAKAQAKLKQAAAQGVASIAGQAAAFAPLFEKTEAARQFDKFQKDYDKMSVKGNLPEEFIGMSGKPLSAAEAYAKATGMTPDQIKNIGGQTVTRIGEDESPYQAFELNPFQVKGQKDLNASSIRQIRKNLRTGTGFDEVPIYDLGYDFLNQ
jgi:hypothetical protein